jgi:hypothetical protein
VDASTTEAAEPVKNVTVNGGDFYLDIAGPVYAKATLSLNETGDPRRRGTVKVSVEGSNRGAVEKPHVCQLVATTGGKKRSNASG